MNLIRAIYTLFTYSSPFFVTIAGFFNEKAARSAKARRDLRKRWASKASSLDRDKKLVWFHVSSVGEFLQAEPVIRLLFEKAGREIRIALTFSSPSGTGHFDRFKDRLEPGAVSFVDSLPFDTPSNARFCLKTLRPDLVVYVKYDLWPNLITEAERRGISQILISAVLSPASKRLWPVVRRFYGRLYGLLSSIAAISAGDARRLAEYAPGAEISVAGDTKFDQVCERVSNPSHGFPSFLEDSGRDYIIAGSTWPEDEEIAITGFMKIAEDHPGVFLILAPHETGGKRISGIEKKLAAEGLSFDRLSRLSGTEPPPSRVIIADEVGYLAELYRFGVLAFVGGGFTTGVHNTLEPAVYALPVFFGPRIGNSGEAASLAEIGCGTIVESADEFSMKASELLNDRRLLQNKGEAGHDFIRRNRGASRESLDMILDYIRKDRG